MLPLLLVGCGAFIPGTWDDYDVPETTQVVGDVGWNDLLGDYWVDNSDYGIAFWGFLESATSTHSASEIEFVVDGCTTEDAVSDWFFDGVTGIGSKSSTLSGDPQIDLEWLRSDKVMYAEPTEEPAGTYSLDEFEADSGTFSAPDALIMPAPVDFHMEMFDTEEAPTVPATDLNHITWEARDDSGLFVNGSIAIVADGSITNFLRCGTTLGAGELDLDVKQLEGFSEADYVVFTVTVFRETAVRLEGSEHAARFVGSRSAVGAAYLSH